MLGEVAIVVANSGVKHELTGGEYNALRGHCESAARKLGVKSLRSVDLKLLAANQSKLSEREYQCAYHVIGEIQRVVFGARALRSGDFAQFGQYMFQSHESSRDFFHNSTVELDALVEIARGLQGCYGARLTGGGFGGATINLVHRGSVDAFIEQLAGAYLKKTRRQTEPMLCEIADGAG
jgi:galactokinase